MFRKLGIGFTALALLVPGLASALGLGEYETDSYLNQPLDFEVELLDTGDLAPDEILVDLAPERDFAMAGVERLYFLNDLDFSVELDGDGTGTLHITSRQPVREPYLNFLVEVVWPTGRLLREYTILLDPPSHEGETADAPAQAPVQQAPAQAPPAPVAAEPAVAAEPRAPVARSSRPPEPVDREEYVVQGSDTMWRIALNNRPAQSVSVQQMLMAIQELNPEAFIDGNVNLVREGTVLRLPTEEEVRRISTRDALAEVAEQNREWRARLEARGIRVPTRAQVDASRTEGRDASGPGTAPQTGRVTLVAPDAGGESGAGEGSAVGGAGEGEGTGSRALQNELVIRDETLDQLRRENSELSGRLDDLQQQVQTSEKLLQLRNDQIARLQEQLRQLQGTGATDAPVVAEPVKPVDDVRPAPPGGQDSVAAGTDAADADAAQPSGDADPATDEPAPAADAVDEPAGASEPGTGPAPVQAPAPDAVEPVVRVDAGSDLLPVIIGGLVVVVAGLGALILLRRRKRARQAAEEELYDEYEAGDDFLAAPLTGGADDEDLLVGFGEDDAAPAAEAPAEPAQDPLEDVDYYVAYGRLPEAIAFLRNEIHRQPARSDLKVRLLELLAETHDREGFEKEAAGFAGDPQVARRADALRATLGGGAGAAGADHEPSLDDLEFDLAADMEPKRRSDDDPIEFVSPSLGEGSAGADEEDETLVLDSGDGLDLDLDLSDARDGEEPGLSLAADEDDENAEELAAALDIDAVLDLDEGGAATDGDVDFGDLSLADASEEFREAAERPAAEDIDLSLDDLDLDDGDLALEEGPAGEAAGDDFELSLEDDGADSALELSLEDDQPAAADEDFELSLEDDDAPTEVGLSAVEEPRTGATVQRPAVESPDARARPADAEPSGTDEDDFDFLADTDENATKLDLAKAYIDMGDAEGARDILSEVLSEGNAQQQQEAKELLAQVG